MGEHRKMSRHRPVILILFLALPGSVLACSAPEVKPATEEEVEPGESDAERRLWKAAEEEIQRIKVSGLLWKDEDVRSYLNDVLRAVLPESTRTKFSFQVYVLKHPDPNAFAFPNGTIFVHTGLLSRMTNEAQLATILGHEAVHAIFRHTTEHMGNVKRKTAGLRWMSILAAPLGEIGQIGYLFARLTTVAAIFGFSRDLEREADKVGFRYLREAGYDPREAPEVFRLLNMSPDRDRDRPPYLYSTHPRNKERRNYLKKRLESMDGEPEGRRKPNTYARMVEEITLWNARRNIERYYLRTARIELDRILERKPEHPVVYSLLARSYLDARPPRLEKATKHLEQARDYGYSSPRYHLLKGQIYLKKEKDSDAAESFREYLEERPDSPYAPMLETFLSDLNN